MILYEEGSWNWPCSIRAMATQRCIISAKCSNEYFVASNRCREYEDLIPRIGSWSSLLSDNELEELLAGLDPTVESEDL